ncbi:MAG: hypothetical protein KIT35_12505 [Piscinibacter sp.]|uniref:hypothetical protein n=1 Tax=Piscinibacter sp. TaxID=1903157 RepID=UPI002588E57F|nr:hypothetical protein [Piscinibacter sp.]MCW5664650.1 hypothetical protein [Piscinibacter sp.]
MPFTLNGTGTKYYGEREHDIGGTYITTKWIVILGIPVLPLSSWRVYPLDDGAFHDYTPMTSREASHTEQTFEAKGVPLNWRQIANVYAIVLPLAALAVWGFKTAFPGFSVKF